ncbi:hypothetical protein J8F10_24130 [Gemmata sp. G18]|uniref:DUF4402 domain-containing protein n=1 Tax=Gemmata palustris TaxID=2822762 RepID=A0ABS5BXB3_9BACT|nr:hypothetical protein [Gemmata palustris]MBP3958349.1 hypothetical protein [Gemmata palustris]
MKLHILIAAVLGLFATGASAATCTTPICKTDGTLSVNSGGTIDFESGSAVETSGLTFSTALTGNPLLQVTKATVTTAQANAGQTILASATGKSIVVGAGFGLYASGTASGATSVSLKCSGGNIIATFPIAALVDATPVGAFSSVNGASITRGTALVSGCPSGEAVQVSSAGTLATTTHLFINLPYTVQ